MFKCRTVKSSKNTDKKNTKLKKIKPTETTDIQSIYDEDGYVIKGKSLMDDLKNPFEELQLFSKVKQYLHLIPNNPSQSFDMFNKIRFFYFHNGGNKKDFIKWWKLSPTYDDDKTQLNIFDTIPDPKNNNINFLKKCSCKSQQDFFLHNPLY